MAPAQNQDLLPDFRNPEGLRVINVVLLDYDMGRHNGTDFLYWLRTMKEIKSIPVVMFSGSPGANHVAECYEAGANYFLNKPLDLARFKSVIQSLYRGIMYRTPNVILRLKEYAADPRVNQVTAGSG